MERESWVKEWIAPGSALRKGGEEGGGVTAARKEKHVSGNL